MTDRRDFLSALAVAGLAAPLGRRRAAPRVEASASVFYAHPVGERTLIRFSVVDANVPAGRMRVFDGSGRRLLGTAGVLGVGGTLFGELWLPLREETRIVTQLEMPGLPRPLRTEHRIAPQPQWTLHWITVADPDQLHHYLTSLSVWRRAAALAMLGTLRVVSNPFPPSQTPVETLDHLELLRRGVPARRLENELGIPVSPVAVIDPHTLQLRGSALGLTSAGVQFVTLRDAADTTVSAAMRGRDGATASVLPFPTGGNPTDLGFTDNRDVMAREIERWLGHLQGSRLPANVAAVVGTAVDDTLPAMARAVADWNSRFAFPRIVVGEASAFLDANRGNRIVTVPPTRRIDYSGQAPEAVQIQEAGARRARERAARVEQMVEPVNRLLGATGGVAGLGQHVGVLLDGTLVFNAAPHPRSDLVTMPDGTEQLVTDVPAVGYAYLPTRTSTAPHPFGQPGPPSAFGQTLTVRLDPTTGALSSMYDRTGDREWVRPGSPGLNAVRGAVLERVTRTRLPDIGMRLTAHRRTDRGTITTTVTVFETQPWIDISNWMDDGPPDMRWDFYFAVDDPRVAWETPAGFEEASAPLGPFAHLRWLQLTSRENWQVLFRGLDAPYAACDANGRVISFAPARRSRYRLKLASPFAPPDEPWHFGWGTDPFVTTPVAAAGAAPGPLPRYGNLLTVREPGIAILGIKQADNGDGAIVYLHELIGAERRVKISAGFLGFRGARRVDVVERHHGEISVTSEPAVAVPIQAHGLAVVRLLDLYIRGG